MVFLQPWWLVLWIPIAAFTIWHARRIRGISRTRRLSIISLRLLIVGLLTAAMAGPEIRLWNSGLAVAFVIDKSDSIATSDLTGATKFVDTALRALKGDDMGSVVITGSVSALESSAQKSRPLGPIKSQIGTRSSNLATGIRLAIASLPSGYNRRVVLVSDGNETEGDLLEAANLAAAEGIAIDVMPMRDRANNSEAFVADLSGPSDARVGSKAALKVRVTATQSMPATLTLECDGKVRSSQAVVLSPGDNTFVLEDQVQAEGLSKYQVNLTALDDTDPKNNTGLAMVNVKGPSRVLLAESGPNPTPLLGALRSRGLKVDWAPPNRVPFRLADLAQYDGIIFNDVNASNWGQSQMAAIRSTIRDAGTGFAMVGGENSFLPGGYYLTPVAEALPVDLNIRQRKDLPSTSLAIIVDCSGSMSMVEDGVPKLELAKKAAEVTATMLGPQDRLAVAGSSDGIEIVVPMGNVVKQQAIAGIRKLGVTGGGIYIGPSVEAAERILEPEKSKVRHLILLADGADSTDWRDAMDRTVSMRKRGITTSVVAFGKGQYEGDLRRLAGLGGGRYYLATRARQLPAIFSQDAAIISRSAIEEGAFFPKQTGSDAALQGMGELPALLAYCLSDSRPLAQTSLRTHKDDPLLAKWQFGLGTSVAFTSDAQARWAQRWVGWEGFDVFWSQLVRGLIRRTASANYDVEVRQSSGTAQVIVRAPEGSEPAALQVAMPDGTAKRIDLQPIGPGEFEAKFDSSLLGSYVLAIVESGASPRVQVESLSRAYPPEYQSAGPNMALLEQVANTTGGKVIEDPKTALRPANKQAMTPVELWYWCLLSAAILFPIDVAARRIIFGSKRPKPAPVKTSEAPRVDRLREAKLRSRAQAIKNQDIQPVENRPAASAQPELPQAKTNQASGTIHSQRLLDRKRERDSQKEEP